MQKPEASVEHVADPSNPGLPPPKISVANSQSIGVQTQDGVTVHAIPTLDGFGLLLVSLLLGAAAFWIWRSQQ